MTSSITQTILLHVHPRRGASIAIEGREGQTLMQAAVAAGVDGITASCGGLMTCATCHVYVMESQMSMLPPAMAGERAMLEFVAAPVRRNSRLACQIELTEAVSGLTVYLPETQE
jgi:2Fe-2S ferredoxin